MRVALGATWPGMLWPSPSSTRFELLGEWGTFGSVDQEIRHCGLGDGAGV